ncbi:MAG TPA: hypothetical protein VFX61_23545, partial [Micromonosporaceae bacterium]|nr:hypothetical protein [Micromonosporaceae bacterium]
AETLAKFRAAISATTAPLGHPAAWLGEIVVHGQDIRRPLGLHGGPSVEVPPLIWSLLIMVLWPWGGTICGSTEEVP